MLDVSFGSIHWIISAMKAVKIFVSGLVLFALGWSV